MTVSACSTRRLRTQCETAKRTLSSAVRSTIENDSHFDGIHYSLTFTRAKFMRVFSCWVHPYPKDLADFTKILER